VTHTDLTNLRAFLVAGRDGTLRPTHWTQWATLLSPLAAVYEGVDTALLEYAKHCVDRLGKGDRKTPFLHPLRHVAYALDVMTGGAGVTFSGVGFDIVTQPERDEQYAIALGIVDKMLAATGARGGAA